MISEFKKVGMRKNQGMKNWREKDTDEESIWHLWWAPVRRRRFSGLVLPGDGRYGGDFTYF